MQKSRNIRASCFSQTSPLTERLQVCERGGLMENGWSQLQSWLALALSLM